MLIWLFGIPICYILLYTCAKYHIFKRPLNTATHYVMGVVSFIWPWLVASIILLILMILMVYIFHRYNNDYKPQPK